MSQVEEKWAACDRCDKWRLLEPSVDIDALPQVRSYDASVVFCSTLPENIGVFQSMFSGMPQLPPNAPIYRSLILGAACGWV